MLRMKPVGKGERGARRAELYYEKTDGGYYAEQDGMHSEWLGKGAEKLGLTGPPDYEHFRRLIRGLDPFTSDQLTARLRDDRIPAWDVTASIPKGPTLAIERGDTRVLDAYRESVREAFAMLEDYATTRVRTDGRQEDRLTGNLIGYFIEHPDTRPVEDETLPEDHPWRVMPLPDRHGHIIVLNETFDAVEGRWKAVKFRPIMDLRKYFDRCFDATFAAKLSDLGYEIQIKRKPDGRYHTWDIKGMPDDVLARLSKRTEEIERLEKEIIDQRKELDPYSPDSLTPVERDQLGASSRRTKRDDLTLEDCRAYWDSLVSPEEGRQIDATIERARKGLNSPPAQAAARAVDFSLRHHFEKDSAVPVEHLMATALEHSIGSARPGDIAAELTRQGVVTIEKDGRKLATLPKLMREEDELIAFAADGRGTVAPIGLVGGLSRRLASGERLTDGQWQAATGLLESENRVNVVLGPAGAGKSKLLKKFDEGAKLAGRNVTYLGTTATSIKVLQEDGFEAATAARFLLDAKMQASAKGGWVVVDETSILGHADAAKLCEVARANDLRLIFVGDPMQHGSIARGSYVRLLTEYGHIKPFRLTEILRQKDPAYREAAQLLSEGRTAEGFDALDRMGWVQEIEHGQDRYAHMAADYVQALDSGLGWKDVLVIAPTHREAGYLNQELRRQLRHTGRLAEGEREFTRLVPVDTSLAEREQEATYRPGDVIQFHQNAKGGFTKGDRLAIGDPAAVPLHLADRFSLYRPESISLAVGDVLRFTATVQTLGKDRHAIKNGATHAVAGFTEAGNIRLDNGWVIGKDAGHFRYGLVETSVGSQGRTVKKTLLAMSSQSRPAIHRQQLYVSASRARESLAIYTDDKAEARDAIQRDSQKLLASDLKPAAGQREQRRRQDIDRRRRLTVYERMKSAWRRVRTQPDRLPTSHAARISYQERSSGYER